MAFRVSDGELWMAPGWEDHLAGLQNRGEVRKELKFYLPEMGMNGGGNAAAIPLNAPHPAAAAVFVILANVARNTNNVQQELRYCTYEYGS